MRRRDENSKKRERSFFREAVKVMLKWGEGRLRVGSNPVGGLLFRDYLSRICPNGTREAFLAGLRGASRKQRE
jgi:hypothetical protein